MSTVEFKTKPIDWSEHLIADVFKGPSARTRINPLCYAAFSRGLVVDNKFSLVEQVARGMDIVQPNGGPPQSLEKINLKQLMRSIGTEPLRPKHVVRLMIEFCFLPSSTK